MVAVLRAKGLPGVRCGAARWTAANIDEDPLAEGVFDVILCSSVCAFLPDYPGTVALLAERLAPGGVFVQWDWERDPSAEEPSGLTTDEIHAALAGAGLTVESVGVGFEATVEGMTMRPLMGVGQRQA
jgi:SAM-dependent methyltransferase